MHVTGRISLAVAIAAVAAGCSGAIAPQTTVPAVIPDARSPRAAATPFEYVYVVNYNGNYIGQYGLYPQSKSLLKPIGPNVSLPCQGPDSFVTIPHKGLAFVSCFSGEVVPLRIKANHTLVSSGVKPVPIPSPLSLLAPRSGAANVVYVTEYPGAIGELHYGKTSLKIENTYQTNSVYPNEMAFYSGGGKAELFVAAPFAQCGSASATGGILAYAQSKAGGLKAQPAIPACGAPYHVVVAGTNLFWAGANVFGGYSLTKNAPLPSPSPPWPANGGPSYYAGAMSVVEAPQKPQAGTPDTPAQTYSGIFTGSDNGSGYLFDAATGKSIDAFTLGTHLAIQAAQCQYLRLGLLVGGARYQGLCFSAAKDSIELRGLREFKPAVRPRLLSGINGSFPIVIHISSPCDDYEYYYYYC